MVLPNIYVAEFSFCKSVGHVTSLGEAQGCTRAPAGVGVRTEHSVRTPNEYVVLFSTTEGFDRYNV